MSEVPLLSTDYKFNFLNRGLRNIFRNGWIKSMRSGNTGIGYTLESLLNIKENNSKKADFLDDIEIKSTRKKSQSMLTLFTLTPSTSIDSTAFLYDLFGQKRDSFKNLHTTIRGSKKNTYKKKYRFYNEVDYHNEKIYICVDDFLTGELLSKDVYYTFNEIKSAASKLKNLALCFADVRKNESQELFKYTDAIFYKDFKFNSFLERIENGIITIDIRIGTYKTGIRTGQSHDHGTAFRIKKGKLQELYEQSQSIISNIDSDIHFL